MRVAVALFATFALGACVTDRPAPVPETGAFTLKLVEVDGDNFLTVEKDGSKTIAQLISSDHPNRSDWKRQDWEWYADELFPDDELNFDGLRRLRGSNLIPVGVDSKTADGSPYCMETEETQLAKFQRRTVKAHEGETARESISLTTECVVHAGLSPTQMASIHQRPHPQRFPTRYETVIDLNSDGEAEQRNVRMRNVTKTEVLMFVHEESSLPRNQKRQLEYAIDRM